MAVYPSCTWGPLDLLIQARAVDALVGRPVRSMELPADLDTVKQFIREHGLVK